MKKIHLFKGLVLLGIVLCISACRRKGCTVPTATNYCSKCRSDENACEYVVTFGFYMDPFYKSYLDSMYTQDNAILKLYYFSDNASSYVPISEQTVSIAAFPTDSSGCDQISVKSIVKYKVGDMPHTCYYGSGSGWIGKTIEKPCFRVQYALEMPGVGQLKAGMITLEAHDTGCKVIKFDCC